MPIDFQRVGRRIKTVAYAGLFGGVLTGLGGIIYTLYNEISETSGSYGMIQKAVSRVESDQKLMKHFGPGPLLVYGQSNRYGRRRPHVISRFLADGTRCYDTSFWVEGPLNHIKALVTLQVIQEEDTTKDKENNSKDYDFKKDQAKGKELKERFLSVELFDEISGKGQKIILIQPQIKNTKFSWNPFSKYFFNK